LSRPQKEGVVKRNVVLRLETHKRLTRYLVELQSQKGDPHMTMDDAVSALLDEHGKHKPRGE